MDRNKVRAILILGILFSILVACGGEPTPDFIQPLSTPTTLVYPSVSPTITPARYIATVTSKPDVATRQEWRSTAIAIATTERAELEKAWYARRTQIAQFSVDCENVDPYSSQISPDGNWVAVSCGPNRDQTLIVKSRQGVIWILKSRDFTIREHEVSLHPEFWSPDGNYLYFYPIIGYSGGGTQCFARPADSPAHFNRNYGLFQLNLTTGSWVTIISPTESFPGYNINFSPSGRRYAVDINGITIFDIKSGDSVQIDASELMDFIWSPDSRHLAYSISKCDEAGWAQSASVYVWDSKINKVQHLFTIQDEKTIIYPESWIDNSTLRVLAVNWAGGDNLYEVYVYDTVNRQFIFSGTATPSP